MRVCVCVCWILFIVKDDRWNKLTHTFIEIGKKQQQKRAWAPSVLVCVFVCICVYPPSGVFCSNSRFHPPKTVHHFEVRQSPQHGDKKEALEKANNRAYAFFENCSTVFLNHKQINDQCDNSLSL